MRMLRLEEKENPQDIALTSSCSFLLSLSMIIIGKESLLFSSDDYRRGLQRTSMRILSLASARALSPSLGCLALAR